MKYDGEYVNELEKELFNIKRQQTVRDARIALE